jgi:hypothetical protein
MQRKTMEELIRINKQEIVSNKKEIERIEKKIDERKVSNKN